MKDAAGALGCGSLPPLYPRELARGDLGEGVIAASKLA